VAARLGLHRITVYRLVKEAGLPFFRIGRMLRFDAEELEKWMFTNNIRQGRKRRRRRAQSVDKPASSSRKRRV
jgi:excisionase family DNA binding protein